MKRVTAKFSTNVVCKKCDGNIGEAMEQVDKLYDEVDTVREFAYLGARLIADG